RCTYDPGTRGGNAPDGRKVKATIHWVDAAKSLPAEIRLYNPLFTLPDPGAGGDLMADLNSNSLEVLTASPLEPSLGEPKTGAATPKPARRSSSSARVISPPTRMGRPANPSSTAPSACATATRRRSSLRRGSLAPTLSPAGRGLDPRSGRVRGSRAEQHLVRT